MKTRRSLRDDSGASLLIALMIVTSVSLVVGAVLSQADTNIRTTIALRDQTSDNYAADAAAETVIAQVQSGALTCATPGGTVVNLGSGVTAPFYAAVAATQSGVVNASAQCTPDTTAGVTRTTAGSGTAASPSYALLTVGTNPTDGGQTYKGTKPVCIDGGSVASNSVISLATRSRRNGRAKRSKAGANSLIVGADASGAGCSVKADPDLTVAAAGDAGCNGTDRDDQPGDFPVTPCTRLKSPIAVSEWKTYAPIPKSPISRVNPPALCRESDGTTFAAFAPGLYTSVDVLNHPCSKQGADVEWLTPGTYYFDYGSTTWNWPATLIGGTPQDKSGAAISTLLKFDPTDTSAANTAKLSALSAVTKFPGSCADPSLPSGLSGVEFVFGGASTVAPSSSGRDEICATYSATSPPVAIYGVAQDVIGAGSLLAPGGSVSAESLCGSPPCTSADTGTATLIHTAKNGRSSFFIEGFTYAPAAHIALTFKKSAGQVFGWGAVLRSLTMTASGTSAAEPFLVTVPGPTTITTTYSIRYINVWTCAAEATPCPQTDPPDVRAKVLTSGSTVKVLAWSHRR